MSGPGPSTSAKGLLNKLIKNSNQQAPQFFSPRRMRSQFKKIDSKTNLMKTNNGKDQVSSPFFQPIVKDPKSKKLNTVGVPKSSSQNKKTDSHNATQDNCESVNTVDENIPILSEGVCSSEDVRENDDVSKLTKKNRIHIKPEFDEKINNGLKLSGKKRKLFPANPDISLEWKPFEWEKTLENIRFMRSTIPAAVDTMGCDKCGDENSDEKTQRFHKLVALMLSSQTRDETTFQAMNRLKEINLVPEHIASMNAEDLEELLKPVSFYKTKTKALQKAAKILIEEYDSDIPKTVDELLKLPGVGPKMAHICMKTAWNITTGIGVDVHVHRIANRLRWVEKPTRTPTQTRLALESWLPEDLWGEVNHLLVGFGQTICTPISPKCDGCLNNRSCPSAFQKAVKKNNNNSK